MSVAGDDLLEAIVRYGWTDGLADRARGASLAMCARVLTGTSDARKVVHRARKLQNAGLVVVERRGGETYAKPTGRGLEVDATLARITAARGGTFAPRSDTDITITEKLALG